MINTANRYLDYFLMYVAACVYLVLCGLLYSAQCFTLATVILMLPGAVAAVAIVYLLCKSRSARRSA